MSESEARLLQLLKDRSFTWGKFRLASGGASDYFIDGKMTGELRSFLEQIEGTFLTEANNPTKLPSSGVVSWSFGDAPSLEDDKP